MDKEILAALTDGPIEAAVAGIVEGISHEDRNVRVAALRLLGRVGDAADQVTTLREQCASVILRALNDDKRRVRDVALRYCARYRWMPEIVTRLREMVEDESEKRKNRSSAVGALADGGRDLPVAAVKSIMELPAVRGRLLFALLISDLTESVEELLREFVEHGTKQEAVAATRALCGYRLAHVGHLDWKRRREIAENHEFYARALYWVRRDEATGPWDADTEK